MPVTPVAVASLALLGFWIIEFTLRKGVAAQSWKTSSEDRGSTAVIIAAYIATALALAFPFGATFMT